MPDAMKNTACAICGKAYPLTEMVNFCGRLLCPHCLDTETFICACCGKCVARSEISANDGDDVEICQSCFDKHFTRCDVCGQLLPQSDAHWLFKAGYEHPYCDACFRHVQHENTYHA